MRDLENRLKYDLFLGGLEMNDEDRKLYDMYLNSNVIKESYPNIYKWRLLVSKNVK